MAFVGFVCLTCLNHIARLLLLIIMHASMTVAVSLECFSPKKICSILASSLSVFRLALCKRGADKFFGEGFGRILPRFFSMRSILMKSLT